MKKKCKIVWLSRFFFLPLHHQTIKQKDMDKNINVRVVGLPIEQYDKEWLNTLSDMELSETALAEGDSEIYLSLAEFQG